MNPLLDFKNQRSNWSGSFNTKCSSRCFLLKAVVVFPSLKKIKLPLNQISLCPLCTILLHNSSYLRNWNKCFMLKRTNLCIVLSILHVLWSHFPIKQGRRPWLAIPVRGFQVFSPWSYMWGPFTSLQKSVSFITPTLLKFFSVMRSVSWSVLTSNLLPFFSLKHWKKAAVLMSIQIKKLTS